MSRDCLIPLPVILLNDQGRGVDIPVFPGNGSGSVGKILLLREFPKKERRNYSSLLITRF